MSRKIREKWIFTRNLHIPGIQESDAPKTSIACTMDMLPYISDLYHICRAHGALFGRTIRHMSQLDWLVDQPSDFPESQSIALVMKLFQTWILIHCRLLRPRKLLLNILIHDLLPQNHLHPGHHLDRGFIKNCMLVKKICQSSKITNTTKLNKNDYCSWLKIINKSYCEKLIKTNKKIKFIIDPTRMLHIPDEHPLI